MKEFFSSKEKADARAAEISEKKLTRVLHYYPDDNGLIVLEYTPIKEVVEMKEEK